MVKSKVLAAGLSALAAVQASGHNSSELPIVDLGYELHQASNFNSTGNFYNFSNIRYAAPPVGNLRFAPPKSPAQDRSQVQTGSIGRICPQASPSWSSIGYEVIVDTVLGVPFNTSRPQPTPGLPNASIPLPPQDPRTSEDCLFLDVFVPKDVLESAGKGQGAPVLVWIYGGGYTVGEKTNNPAGLLAASGNASDGNIIYVAMNYRLGALGWSGGPSFQAEGGTSNLGLLDQRFALEWVKKNIHLFGGDAKRVTVFGESAGGGSLMHQITAYGGSKGPVPFQQAIPQSPGWLPLSSQLQQEDHYQRLLSLTNTTSLSELRAVSSEVLMHANFLQIAYDSPYSSYIYGPAVDGDFVPLQPGQLLAQGRFDKSLRVMVGHNAHEGTYFTSPWINSDSTLLATLRGSYPYAPNSSLSYVIDTLYPPDFNGSYGYKTQFERASLIVSESVFTCNTFYLDKAYKNETYSYLFAVPPGFHGIDVSYTYYDGGAAGGVNPLFVQNRTVALALQDFITSFAIEGKPHADGIMAFNMYGPNARVLDINITSITEVMDSNANERCNWWQKALNT